MAATRTPSGATLKPVISPPKSLDIACWLILPLLVGVIIEVASFSVTQRLSMRSQLIALTSDTGMGSDGLLLPDGHT